ncbi:MAG: hypothetical protein R3C44_23790 [Chloroflexota bacterium]
MVEKSLREIDWDALINGRTFHPSPATWVDQVLYFLMLDRFSDGNEKGYRDNNGNIVNSGTTPPFQKSDEGTRFPRRKILNGGRTPACALSVAPSRGWKASWDISNGWG